MEIFKYEETATTLNMIRFDSSSDWDYRFCPYLSTPWKFCELLNTLGGNEMFWPTLTIAQQNDLLNEALLMGKQFNFAASSGATQNIEKTRVEVSRTDWEYQVVHNVALLMDLEYLRYLLMRGAA